MKLFATISVMLFALVGVATLVPAASAQPCTMSNCCAVTMCTCVVCELHNITIDCGTPIHAPTQWATVEGWPACGLTVGVCTSVGFASIDPHGPGRLYCRAQTYATLP